MRRHIHWAAVVLALAALLVEALAWGGAVNARGVGSAIRRSIGHEAPVATAYAAIGEALRAVPVLRDYSDAYAGDALAELAPRIVEQPALATELLFGASTTPRHARLKWFYYAPWILLALAAWLFATRPPTVHLVPKRR